MTRSLVLSTLVAVGFSLVLSTSDAEAGRRHRRCCGGGWGYTNYGGCHTGFAGGCNTGYAGGCHTGFAGCNTGCGTYGYSTGTACGAGGCAPTYSGSGPVPMQSNYGPTTNGNAAPPPPAEPLPPQPGT